MGRPFPPYDFYLLSCVELNNTILNSSYLNNVKNFNLGQSFVYFNINEGTNFTNLKVINIWAHNIPDLSSYTSLYSVYLTLSSDYNKTTISNYANIKCTRIQIRFQQNSLPIPSFIETNRVVSYVSIYDQPFSKPSSVIDIPNNGKCNSNTGECECNDSFKGFDCSTIIEITTPSTNSSIDIDTGGVTIGNQNTNYEISILSLNEISIDGSTIIKSHPLKGNWSIDNEGTDTTTTTTTNSNIFKFSQKLINNTCTIIYTIEEIKLKDKSFTFGSTSFTVEKDSLKLSVLIKDYQYQSSLNTLQLIFYSAAVDTNNDDDDDCNKKETSISTSNLNNQQNLNYIQISKNSKTLVGRFINQVIADSRPTFMSSTIINDNNSNSNNNSIKIGLNLPHCFECLIDPDFSILVSSDFKESCDKSSQKNKWIIPVSVVVSVVGFSIIVTISIILYMKHKYTFKIFSMKLKTFKKGK
ncbi:hypothetical protein ACTFIZ_008887 [Dictyostelium cf. discoideum]